jgi:hypothetical protein
MNSTVADHGAALVNFELPGCGAVWSLCRRWTRICPIASEGKATAYLAGFLAYERKPGAELRHESSAIPGH